MISFLPMVADVWHAGNIRLINKASEYGEVIVGILSKQACSECGEFPFLEAKFRIEAAKGILNVKKVIEIENLSDLNQFSKLNFVIFFMETTGIMVSWLS